MKNIDNNSQVSFIVPFKLDVTQMLQEITDVIDEILFYDVTKKPHSVNKTIFLRSKAPKEKLLEVCKPLVQNVKLDNTQIIK